MATIYRTMQEIVFETLQEGILNGRYMPGQRLIADELARELGVSRMPVREALHRLQATGLVTIAPHRGIQVNTFSEQEIAEIYHMRAVLEGLATRLAAQNNTEKDIAAMNDVLDKFDRAVTAGNVKNGLQLNREFHMLIWRAAQSPRLEALILNLYNTSERYRTASMMLPSRLQEISREHRRIVQALAAHDCATAERMANEHHEVTAKRLLRSIESKRVSNEVK